jgi:membrane-bound lytic murein transglycosylase D
MHYSYLKIISILIIGISLIGCDTPNRTGYSSMQLVREKTTKTVWDRLSQRAELNTHHQNPRVKHYIAQYSKYKGQYLSKYTEFSAPYIYHIMNMLEEQNMPIELALLPIIESEYRPNATSPVGATGIWQISAITGRVYGLKQDNWHDQRKDIEAATKAALKYLQTLANRYDGDWLLALAAYNSGHGRVDQAIRQNKRLGKSRDFWSLNLPKETMHFVPKFLAVAYLVQNANDMNINLAPIENKAYFTTVKLEKPIELHKAAAMAKVDIKEIRKLNPSIRTNSTHPNGPHKLVLPIKNAYIFRANYVASQQQPKATAAKSKTASGITKVSSSKPTKKYDTTIGTTYTVVSGDTLRAIAAKHKTSIRHIKTKNNLKSDIIRSGQQLVI